MAGTNFFAKLDNAVRVSLTNDDNFAIYAECDGNPSLVATANGIFLPGCIMRRTDFNMGENLYQNTGTLNSPSWTAITSGGGNVSGSGQVNYITYWTGVNTISGSTEFQFNPTTKKFEVTRLGNRTLTIDPANNLYQMGDIDGIGSGGRFLIVDSVGSKAIALITGGDVIRVDMDGINSRIGIGDTTNVGNGTNFFLDDGTQTMTARLNGFFDINEEATGEPRLAVDTTNIIVAGGDTLLTHNGFRFAIFDQLKTMDFAAPSGVARFGDIDSSGSGTILEVSDLTGVIRGESLRYFLSVPGGTSNMLTLDSGNALYTLGNDGSGNGTSINLNDDGLVRRALITADYKFLFQTNAGLPFIDIDIPNGTYHLGNPTENSGNNPQIIWNNTDRNIYLYGGIQFKTAIAGGGFGNVGTQYKNVDFDTGTFGGSCTLPEITGSMLGTEITISDYTGNAGTLNITINAFAGDTIQGNPSISINQDWGSITLHANHFNNSWVVTSKTF